MASGWTNRGVFTAFDGLVRATAFPTTMKLMLATSASTPTADTNTFAELTEIAAGNGYTAGGITVNRDATDWDTITEDDTADSAFAQLKNIVWTAAGGPIPASGDGARWAILTDDNATINSREVYAYFDLTSDRSVSDTQTLTLIDTELRFNVV